MDLDQAIELLKKAVKYTGTIDQKHIDLTLVPAEDRQQYEEALRAAYLGIKEGKITREIFNRRVHLEG